MRILEKEFNNINNEQLHEMMNESELIISSFTDGLKGVGEFMQVTDITNVSPDAVRNVGSMLIALGYVIEATTFNKSQIVLAMKK